MPCLGITGSFGSGKTTVADFLKELGASVLDADKIVHQLISPRGRCFKPIIKEFGRGILIRGEVNRRTLGAIVFHSAQRRETLERIIHPQVIKRIKEALQEGKKTKKITAVEIPLLFEKKLNKFFDYVIVVKANQKKQINRLKKRTSLTTGEILGRLKAQWPINKKVRLADFVIDNTGSLKETQKQVLGIWRRLTSKN